MDNFAAIILAAGRGTRMKSKQTKILHQIGHKPLVSYPIKAAKAAGISDICLVVGYAADEVQAALGAEYKYACQEQQLGTGHAAMQGLPLIAASENCLVLCGDTPLLRAETLRCFCQQFIASQATAMVMTAKFAEGGPYGRIIRDSQNNVQAIVEARDATEQQLAIKEINSGVYCFKTKALEQALQKLEPNNDQQEYYLTDVIDGLNQAGHQVGAYLCADAKEIIGVNDQVELAEAAAILRQRKNRELMLSGITMVDPSTVYIDDEVQIGAECLIEPNVYIEGQTVIGANCHLGPNVKIVDSTIGNGCEVGPFCLIRPGTVLKDKAKAGHFVELKKSSIGAGSKVPHLSYIGDTTIGEGVNIGCGTITCNYDGVNKHPTTIEDGAFIGSNTNFIAPVKVGKNATVAAGSTISNDVPEGSLAIERSQQRNIEGWAERRAKKSVKKQD